MKDRIKEARLSAKLTQRALAEMIGLNHSTIAMAEAGKINPSPRTLRDIATACGVSEEWLKTGEGMMREEPTEDPDSTLHYMESEYELPPKMVELLRAYLTLPKEGKDLIDSFVATAASTIMEVSASSEAPQKPVDQPEKDSASDIPEGLSPEEAELIRQARLEKREETSSGSSHGESGTA